MLFTSFRAKIPKLYSGQNSWFAGPIGVMEKIWIFFFFSCKRFFQLCLGPLNILSTNFCTKNAEIVLRSKFMVSRTMGHYGTNLNLGYLFIFVLFYFILFLLRKIFPIVSWTPKYSIYKFPCKTTEIVFWLKFLANRTWRHLRTNFKI